MVFLKLKLKNTYEKPSEKKKKIFKVIKLKNTYEKPSEKKRILQENIKRVKKLNKLKNRI